MEKEILRLRKGKIHNDFWSKAGLISISQNIKIALRNFCPFLYHQYSIEKRSIDDAKIQTELKSQIVSEFLKGFKDKRFAKNTRPHEARFIVG